MATNLLVQQGLNAWDENGILILIRWNVKKKSEDMIEAQENDDQNCPAPPIIKNGKVGPHRENGEPYRVGDELLVHCDFYYKAVQGDTYLRCIEGPRWSGTFPICLPTCKPLPEYDNGEWKFEDNEKTKELEAYFVCKPGYQLTRGLQGLKCIRGYRGYQWIGENPQCQALEFTIEDKKKTCPTPPKIENGDVFPKKMGEGYFVGEEINIECKPLFHPVDGGSVLYCTDDGTWSDDFAQCVGSQCGAPPEINDGYLSVYDHSEFYHVGYRAGVQCKRGFIKKKEEVTCLPNGKWDVEEPMCQGRSKGFQCGPPPPINYGILLYHQRDSYPAGSRAVVQCNGGFIKKKEEVTCLPNGEWDVEEPMCQRTMEDAICGVPPPINDGYLWVRDKSEFYPVGYRADVQCNPGFIQRKKQVTCQLDGIWDAEEVMCQRRSEGLQCGPPPRISDGTLRYYQRDYYPVGTRASVQCNPGFIKRKEEVTCLENGKWDVEDTLCQGSFKASGCGPVPRIENGVLVIYPSDELYFIGAVAVVRCDRGYDQKNFYVACLENGNWNITGRECQIKETSCGKVPRISNGIIQTPAGMQNYPVGTEANVICDQGFHSLAI